MQNIRVLIADDHAVVCQGLRALLEAEPGIEVVAEVGTGQEAVRLTAIHSPDVVLMDIVMPRLNGLEATREIKRLNPSIKVLVLSSYDEESYVSKLIEAGASGYLLKQTAANDLLHALREVCRGRNFYDPRILQKLNLLNSHDSTRKRCKRKGYGPLTSRETETLQLIAEGKPNKQIAANLSISQKTVEKHRQSLMNKLHIHDISGLTRYAVEKGIVKLDSDPTHPLSPAWLRCPGLGRNRSLAGLEGPS